MQNNEEQWLLRPAAAAYLGLSVSGLAHMACKGLGPRYYRAGKRVRYLRSDLDAWAQSECCEPLPPLLQTFIRSRTRSARY
jgi:predicted DNA-binding transcriptional regulator AlpA